MLLHVNFGVEKNSDFILPRVNLHLVQAAIYSTLPGKISAFLHDEAFNVDGRRMKLFAFGWPRSFFPPRFDSERIFMKPPITMSFASPVADIVNSLVKSILKQRVIRIGRNILHYIDSTILSPQAQKEEITVATLSPITIYRSFRDVGDKSYTVYHHPGEEVFCEQAHVNLARKFRAFHPDASVPEGRVSIVPEGKFVERVALFSPDDHRPIKGWHGRFKLRGPKELLQMALDAGIGAKNSSGWGCVEKL